MEKIDLKVEKKKKKEEEKIKLKEDSLKLPTKKIIYKGKEKEIPIHNPDTNKCEFYIIKKFKYCNFNKYNGSEFCVYHKPNEEEEFLICPYDSKHRILKSKYENHLKNCNTLKNENKHKEFPWYSENINKAKENKNYSLPSKEELEKLYNMKYEDLEIEEYSKMIDLIISSYEICKNIYSKYVEDNKLRELILENYNKNNENKDINYLISGININIEKDLKETDQIIHSKKHEIQNEAISKLIFKSNLLDINTENCIIIEFGAGKGGLSEEISKINNEKSPIILLERKGGLRYKKEKNRKNMIRYRTDIIDFNLNYLDKIEEIPVEKETFEKLKENYYFIGVAKHICGCAFDLSLTCLFNYNNLNKIKGLCMATCCHHICRVELLNNIDFYIDDLKMNVKQIIFLFKATSWIFGPINDKEKNKSEKEKAFEEIFIQKKISKKYIGLISKYIVDIARCVYLINKGFKTFYMKYCDNKITTENNLILAINN